MNQIQIKTSITSIPGKWEELQPAQVLGVAWVFYTFSDFFAARYSCMLVLLGVKPYKRLQWFNPWYRLLRHCDKSAIAETLIRGIRDEQYYETLTEEQQKNYDQRMEQEGRNNPVAFLFGDRKLTKNPLPQIGPYFGPKDILLNVCFGEFIYLEKKLESVFTNNQVNLPALDELCAILYREPDPLYNPADAKHNQDIRMKFTDNTIAPRARYFGKRVSIYKKYAVLLFVTGCLNKFKDLYPLLFSKAKPATSGSGTVGSRFGWNGVILQLSGKEFGDYESTKYTNVHVIFTQLHILKEKSIKAIPTT